jgi:glycosyltransferase involved in cell wall biosynthesis
MTLRILHISQSINPKHGGPIEGIRQQAKEHARQGHIVDLACLDIPNSPHLPLPGIKVYPLFKNSFDRFFPFSLVKWLRLYHNKYDAVIINGIWGFHMLASWIALRTCNTPYFVFTHGMLDPWFRRTYPFKHFKKWLLWPWAVYPVLRDASSLLFTCEREKILARHSFWLYDCFETVIDYGTEGVPPAMENSYSKFLSNHPDLSHKQLILFLGRVHPKKGADLLVRAVHALQAEGIWNSAQVCLVMAGPADSIYAKELIKLADEIGVSDSFYWTGMISGQEKWGAFQAADAFILPSHQENFGIAVAEALSCGTPVLISSSVNIAPEIAADGAGFVESDTLDGTTKLIRRWLSLGTKDKLDMRLLARSCFLNRFHISNTTKSIQKAIMLALLERAIHQSSLHFSR